MLYNSNVVVADTLCGVLECSFFFVTQHTQLLRGNVSIMSNI